jgi:hypothetical protein
MNERLKQLADQAETKEIGYYFFDKEKFAELIVRECADIADKAEPYKSNDLIRKHFGVEE